MNKEQRYATTHSSQTAFTPAESAPQVYERVRHTASNFEEFWKSVVGLEGRLEVSSHGRIRSIITSTAENVGAYRPDAKILKFHICEQGHQRLVVVSEGKPVTVRINRVVATAFVPNPDNLPYVRHKDSNKLNNRADNLVWTNKRLKRTGKEGQSHV